MTQIESVEQVEALPTGSVIEDHFHGYHVVYTKLEDGSWDMNPLAAPSEEMLMDVRLTAYSAQLNGGFPTSAFQRGLDVGAVLTLRVNEEVSV